jgi:hypothetical protein
MIKTCARMRAVNCMPYLGYKERRSKFSPSQTIRNKTVTDTRNIVELKRRKVTIGRE